MWFRNITLLWLFILKNTVGIKVIGEKQTVIQGQNVSFPCTLTEMPATDEIAQIFWKRKTRENLVYSDFFTISPEYGPESVDAGHDARFKFIGSLNEKNGSIQLSNATLWDDGVYRCIFTLFPSGSYNTEIPLTVLVPPVTSLKIKVPVPVVGEDWVTYASCIAAGAKPPAEVTWDTPGSSQGSLTVVTNSTEHANGTTTTISHLVGTPTREINHLHVQCVVKQHALATEDTLPFTIEVHYAPMSVNIRETSKEVLECVSDSSPKATYTWSRVNQSWPSSGINAEGEVLHLVSTTPDLAGLYVCEAANDYGRKNVSLYVYHATATDRDCVACWTLLVFITIAVAVGLALWYYQQRFGVLPWKEVRFQRPSGDDNQNVEEENAPEEVDTQS